ncbi:MAG: APC family permease [Microcystis aeruginosa W13-11]|nr:APC family permease [Microcystis aeruginosa W13-11]
MNNSNQTWERVVAIILATGVLITFVFIIFNPQKLNTSTFAIIRFLAAFAAAVSGYLFIGTLEVKARLPFKRGIAKGTGAFAIFIVIYFLFYHNLPPSEPDYSYERTNSGLEPGIFKGKYQSDLVDYKHFTGNNEYPVLAFLSSKFPEEFNDILGLSNSPIIQTKNPVYENIQKFRDESGNQDLVSNYLSPSRYEYTYNENNKTTVASEEIERGELIGKKQKLTKKISENKTFNQKSNEYNDKTLVRDGEGNEFTYVPKLASLQTSLDDAKYTSFLKSEASSYYTQEPTLGEIFQFPKLSSLTYDSIYNRKQINTLSWINNIISHNPNQRGLIAYTYNFLGKDSGQGIDKNRKKCRLRG